jgi:hypothetical protein
MADGEVVPGSTLSAIAWCLVIAGTLCALMPWSDQAVTALALVLTPLLALGTVSCAVATSLIIVALLKQQTPWRWLELITAVLATAHAGIMTCLSTVMWGMC